MPLPNPASSVTVRPTNEGSFLVHLPGASPYRSSCVASPVVSVGLSPIAVRLSPSSTPTCSNNCSRVLRTSSSLPLSTASTVSPSSKPSKTLSSAPRASPNLPCNNSLIALTRFSKISGCWPRVSRAFSRMARTSSSHTFKSTFALTPSITSLTRLSLASTPTCRFTRLASCARTETWALRPATSRVIFSTSSSETSSSTSSSLRVVRLSSLSSLAGALSSPFRRVGVCAASAFRPTCSSDIGRLLLLPQAREVDLIPTATMMPPAEAQRQLPRTALLPRSQVSDGPPPSRAIYCARRAFVSLFLCFDYDRQNRRTVAANVEGVRDQLPVAVLSYHALVERKAVRFISLSTEASISAGATY